MGIIVAWDNPRQTVIRWDFERQWDAHDLMSAEKKTIEMQCSTSDVIIDLIINVKFASSWPNNSFISFKNALLESSHREGLKVVVGTDTFLKLMFKTLGVNYSDFVEGLTFVEDLGEARELLLQ